MERVKPTDVPQTARSARPTLFGRAFVALCITVLLGFGCFAMLTPVIPVIVLRLGGDAALVGLVVALHSIPSLLLRPFMGRLVDAWSRWRVFLGGAVLLFVSTFLHLLPGLALLFGVRLLNGVAFSAFNTAGNATLAALAPPSRRGEAAGIYNLMPNLAFMIAPAVGLILLERIGPAIVFIVAGLLGAAGTLVAASGTIRNAARQSAYVAGPGSSLAGLIDRRALLPMLTEFLWIAVATLFLVFPPVWAEERGIPLADLTLYYPAVGAVLVVSRIAIGRVIDRVPRGLAILAGAAIGGIALLVASTAETVLALTVAGSIHAIGSSAVSPMAAALAIDRAEPGRQGATMATYSMGFPLGNGVGALTWGLVITAVGFPAPFLLALGALACIAALVWSARAELLGVRAVPQRG